MKITICGSMQFSQNMLDVAEELRQNGHSVETPSLVEGRVYEDNLDADSGWKRGFIDEHFRKIDQSEAILVVNETKKGVENYVGGNTLVEIGYAYGQGLDIFLLNPVPDMSYTDEINGMNPIVLDGDLSKIDRHLESLPLVYMSTESALKHRAVSRVMRKLGIPVRVDGKKVDTGVEEQPKSIDETYQGAANRHVSLKLLGVEADYYVTVESGIHFVRENHNYFGCAVVIIEKQGSPSMTGIDLDMEIPKNLTDKVPSVYPDLGTLAQKEYGIVEKDPYLYMTDGKLSRQEVIEKALYNVFVQMKGEQ